jgi:hypothetical protein
VIRSIIIKFGGSFQCRLAVGRDGSDTSPTDPDGVYGTRGAGEGDGRHATYAYRENPFDRIIRFSDPVDLRSALVDPWEDTRVSAVLLGADLDLEDDVGNSMKGQVVSLGSTPKFEEDGPYNIIDLSFSIGGGTFFAGLPTGPVPQRIIMEDGGKELFNEYMIKKQKLLQTSTLDPVREQVLKSFNPFFHEDGVMAYAGIFRKFSQYEFYFIPSSTRLPRPISHKKFGTTDQPQNYYWYASFRFGRWDGDTLTGRVSGTLIASHQSFWADVATTVGRISSPYLKWLSQ